ncbi:MAG: hypothetical protein KGL31_06610 [candidate division NC10 bacterium]|nr:hypothetical protein [candidate division NC10 bacterium]MDE2321575.1 hypothetical protein [candidate division NC10 bacterium]
MPRRKTDPTIPVSDPPTPEQKARTLATRLQAAIEAAPVKQDAWTSDWCSLLHALRDVAFPEGDDPEHKRLEQRGGQGDIGALAELIQRDPDYLKTPQVVMAIRVLRFRMVHARTPKQQREAKAGLEMLAKALLPDLRGNKCSPAPSDVARVYRDMLAAYQAVKQGKEPPTVQLPRGYWPDTGPCPTHVTPAGPYTPVKGKLPLLPSPTFTIPKEDLVQLKDWKGGSNTPARLALKRTAELFGLSEYSIEKYKALGKKERTGK